jgi:hypothetical protein
MIKEISQFIASKTSFVIGDTLQVGHRLQNAPDRCQTVLETGGGHPYFDLPDRIDKAIQIMSRAKTYFNARDDAWEVFNAIHGTAGWQLTGSKEIMTIEALADPQYIGQDEKGRYEFSTNYIFKWENPP